MSYATCEIHTALLRYSRSYKSKPRGVRYSLVLGCGSARLEASYIGQSHGKNAYDSRLPIASQVVFLPRIFHGLQTDIFSGPWLSDHAARHKNSACQKYALAIYVGARAGAKARLD